MNKYVICNFSNMPDFSKYIDVYKNYYRKAFSVYHLDKNVTYRQAVTNNRIVIESFEKWNEIELFQCLRVNFIDA